MNAPKTAPSPNSGREGAIALLLALGSLMVVTCSSGHTSSPSRSPGALEVAQPQAAKATPESRSPHPSALQDAVANEATGPQQEAARAIASGPLSSFWAALQALKHGQREDPVRVLWLGDSHTAADFWVHPVRELLSQRAGVGGPGYLQVGLGVFRHGAARVESTGNWRVEPRAPSYFVGQQADGVYGLAGVRTVPKDAKALATVRVAQPGLQGPVRWEVLYRLPKKGSRFTVRLEPGETVAVTANSGQAVSSGLHRVSFESGASTVLHIGQAVSEPEIFGVVVEAIEPGVVIDTLGINGARVATTLTWNEEHFVAEVQRRAPSLVVLAYGANEVGDALAPFRYGPHYDALLGRLRRAIPGVGCLIVGSTDRALPDWTTNPRVVAIEQVQRQAAERHGCEFFSVLGAMGGEGSLQRWAFASPPLARKDRVHLTPQGYTTLGEALGHALLTGYPGLVGYPGKSKSAPQ